MEEDEEASKKLEKERSERRKPKEKKASRKSKWSSQVRPEKMPTGFDSHVTGDIKTGKKTEARQHMYLGINAQYILSRCLFLKGVKEQRGRWRSRGGEAAGRRARTHRRAADRGCRASEVFFFKQRIQNI